jgi:hypothetical protein
MAAASPRPEERELVALLRARLAAAEAEAVEARAGEARALHDARQIALYNRQLLDRLAALDETSTTPTHSRVRVQCPHPLPLALHTPTPQGVVFRCGGEPVLCSPQHVAAGA